MQRLKVLISTYGCEPGRGSEPGVGWGFVRALAAFHDVWAITAEVNRPAIEKELASRPVPGLHFVYWDLPRWTRWWQRGERGIRTHYYLWQVGVHVPARRLHRRVGFDLAHHLTWVKYSAPSSLALLPVPFLWGPVGGGESAPRAFRKDFGWRGRLYESLRDLARRLGEHDPLVRLTARRCTRAWATTPETAERLRALKVRAVEVLQASALAREEIERLGATPAADGPAPRFLSLGRLLHWKGFHLGLRAFAAAKPEGAEYWIVGDGPERGRLAALVRELGIEDRVRFRGALPREEVFRTLSESHVLVHPSLHDSGGWACLEAMAAGRPVICLNLGGPALLVSDETGFRVPARDPDQAVADLATAMSRLARDPALRASMGEAGRRRVRKEFSWEARIPLLLRRYEEVVSARAGQPQRDSSAALVS